MISKKNELKKLKDEVEELRRSISNIMDYLNEQMVDTCKRKSAKLDIDNEIKTLYHEYDFPKELNMNKLCESFGKENYFKIAEALYKYYVIERHLARQDMTGWKMLGPMEEEKIVNKIVENIINDFNIELYLNSEVRSHFFTTCGISKAKEEFLQEEICNAIKRIEREFGVEEKDFILRKK